MNARLSLSHSLRRLRLVLPSDGAVVTFALVFLLLEVPFHLIELAFGGMGAGGRPHPAKALLIGGSVVLGIRRSMAYHPYYIADYKAWLARTPWKRGMPLPGGPVFPVPEDLLVAGGLALLAFSQPELDPLGIVIRYLIGYAIGLCSALWNTGASTYGYLTLFGMGLAVRFWSTPMASFLAVIATLPVTLLGVWTSLASFPWDPQKKTVKLQASTDLTSPEIEYPCGWPFDALSPKVAESKESSTIDKLLSSLIVGWLAFCACGLMHDDAQQIVLNFALVVELVILIPGRILVYGSGFRPPISFMGRIRTMRWIIPGYDKVLIAPILTLAVVMVSYVEFQRLALPREISYPLMIALALFVATTTGPSLKVWRLTCACRMVPKQGAQPTEYVKIS